MAGEIGQGHEQLHADLARIAEALGGQASQIVQVVTNQYSGVATGTTVIPQDDTIPQYTEGDLYMTVTITPKATTNRLLVEAVALAAGSIASPIVAALFKDTGPDAVAATVQFQATATALTNLTLSHELEAGQTTPITFRFRMGLTGAGTLTFNGSGGTRRFGTAYKSLIKVTEYKL